MKKVIAFDADDTLWVNEPLFRRAEEEFCNLMAKFLDHETCAHKLFDFEMQNLHLYGYGIKPFTLSLTEAAIKLSNGAVTNDVLLSIIDIGKTMLRAPVEVLDGVEKLLDTLSQKHNIKLVVATKGDLLDQERKLEKSGLAKYFHHIEVMSNKKPANYQKLLRHLDIEASQFIMVGNSVKSDIIPVLEIGGTAFYIPFHTTWEHEVVLEPIKHPNFIELKSLLELEEHL